MKRIFLVFVILFAVSTTGKAQIINDVSLTATVNRSAVYSPDRTVVRIPSTGWELGFSGEKRIINFFGISAGMRISSIRFGLDRAGVSHVTYLSFPVNLKIIFPLGVYAKAGLRYDLRIAYNNAWGDQFGEGFASASDPYETGWQTGMGKIFNFNGLKPWIEVMYTKDYDKFSGYEGIISVNKKTLKINIGIPILNW